MKRAGWRTVQGHVTPWATFTPSCRTGGSPSASRPQDITRQAVERQCHRTVHRREIKRKFYCSVYCFLSVRVHSVRNQCFSSSERLSWTSSPLSASPEPQPHPTCWASSISGSDEKCQRVKVCGKLALQSSRNQRQAPRHLGKCLIS